MEKCLHEEKSKMKVVDEEIDKTINLSSLIIITHTPPEDPFLSWTPPASLHVLHELKQSSSQAYHSKLCVVCSTCNLVSDLANLERTTNQNPYVVIHDNYYGQKPLFD